MVNPNVPYIGSVETGLGEVETLLHVPIENRPAVGEEIAAFVENVMRREALASGRTVQDVASLKLCPGCIGAVMVNAMLKLAHDNDQAYTHLAHYVGGALDKVARSNQPKVMRSGVLPCAERTHYDAYL